MLRYNHVKSNAFIDTLFAESEIKGKRQFTCVRLFVTDFGYTHIVPMNYEKYFQHAMMNFFKNVGVLPAIIANFSGK